MVATKKLAIGIAALLCVGAAASRPIDLPGERLFPESVTTTRDGMAYVGSMNGGVLRIHLATARVEPWIQPGAFGTGALFGVFADARNGLLWTCTNDFSAQGVSVANADPGAWAKAFDLRTGQGRISLKLPGEHPTCNDFAVGRDGTVFVTDTGNPRILRWRPGTQTLEIWAEDPVFDAPPRGGGLDGIAIGGDGNIYVNNVRSGALFRVIVGKDGKAGAVTKLTLSRPLVSPDGMRAAGGLRFVVAEQEGRVTRLTVTGDRVEVRTLADGLVSPTGVAVWHGKVWVVQGQLGALFRRAGAVPPTLPFHLSPVSLRPKQD